MKKRVNSRQVPSDFHLRTGWMTSELSLSELVTGIKRTPSFSNFSDWSYVGRGMAAAAPSYLGGVVVVVVVSLTDSNCW